MTTPKIWALHLTGIGGYGNRLPEEGKPDKYISHVSVRLQWEMLPGVEGIIMKGGLLNIPERMVYRRLKKQIAPGDLIVAVAHSYGARDLFERILKKGYEERVLDFNSHWIGVVIADMEWAPGLLRDDKRYQAPPVHWGHNFYQPKGLGGTLIEWDWAAARAWHAVRRDYSPFLMNQRVEDSHARIDTGPHVRDAVRKLYQAALDEQARRTKERR